MKNHFILFLIFLILIPPVIAGDWSVVNIGGNDFNIPPQYSGGDLKNNEYKLNNYNTFAIIELDESLLISNYAYWAASSDYNEKTVIGGHDIRFYHDSKINVSHLYYTVNDSFYGIFWQGDNINSDIERIINTSSPSTIDKETFDAILDNAIDIRKQNNAINLSAPESIYIDNSNNNHNSKIWYWYFLNR